jgi:glutathione S-transferase
MAIPVLHIGDRNYSSWSMRAWLALKHGGIHFKEVHHDLPEMGGKPSFGAFSPNARVPALVVDNVTIAESLAICEWAAERHAALWPKDKTTRALARSSAAIMHSGFAALRTDCPFNIRRRTDAGRMTPDGRADAERVDELWREWLKRSGGPFLFGEWSIADAMYAPVVTRFITYAIPRSPEAESYINLTVAEPHTATWIAAAMKETRQLPRSDSA